MSVSTTVRGPYAKGVQRRAQILDAALRAYENPNGIRPTLSEIGDEVGMSGAGILHYFGGLDQLFVAILESRDAEAAQHYPLSDPEGVWAYLTGTTKTPGLTRLYIDMAVAAADPNHPAAEFIRTHRASVASVIRNTFHVDDSQTISLIIAAAEGLQLMWLNDPTIDIAAALRQLLLQLVPPTQLKHI